MRAQIRHALVRAELGLKAHEAAFSAQATAAFLGALRTLFEAPGAAHALGSLASLSRDGVVEQLWEGAAHKRWVPTAALAAIVEAHSLPEALHQFSHVLSAQIESAAHDTQVAVDEAALHPVGVRNGNARMLHRCAVPSAVQRTHHWSPLDRAVDFVQTPADVARGVYDSPKDRHVVPWIETLARFGVIPRCEPPEPAAPAAE